MGYLLSGHSINKRRIWNDRMNNLTSSSRHEVIIKRKRKWEAFLVLSRLQHTSSQHVHDGVWLVVVVWDGVEVGADLLATKGVEKQQLVLLLSRWAALCDLQVRNYWHNEYRKADAAPKSIFNHFIYGWDFKYLSTIIHDSILRNRYLHNKQSLIWWFSKSLSLKTFDSVIWLLIWKTLFTFHLMR